MQLFSLGDSYRSQVSWGGYTWGRDNPYIIRSRLDMILIPTQDVTSIHEINTTKYPNESDHYFLYMGLNTSNIAHGKGIMRCNSSLTENIDVKLSIEKQIVDILKEKVSLSIHDRWDYCKMKIRQVYILEGKKNQ